jgi:hypothetical protein
MHKIKEFLMKELESIDKKGQLSMSDLDKVHKMTDTIKNIDKIEMLEDGGYSEDGHYMGEGRIYGTSYDDGTSYARGRIRAKRDSMGRYSRDGGYAEDSRGGLRGYSYGGYSYKDKDEMIEHLREMMGEASTTKEREAIKRCIREMEDD